MTYPRNYEPRSPFTLVLVAALSAACGGTDDPSAAAVTLSDLVEGPFPSGTASVDRAGAEARALALVGGTVLASELEEERGLDAWEVEIRRASGAIVEVDVVASTGDILEVECDHAVAGDDLRVEPGFLSLREAVALATTARPGAVLAWEIELDDDLRWTWEIELRTATGEAVEVEVDARSGDVEIDDDGRDDWDDPAPPRPPRGVLPALEAAAAVIVPGSIVDAEPEDDGEIWDIEVRTPGGARVKLELLRSGRLVEAESEDDGRVDYDVTPPGLVPLSGALRAAGRDARDLDGWELEREDDRLVWSLDFDDDDIDVDAHSGAVL